MNQDEQHIFFIDQAIAECADVLTDLRNARQTLDSTKGTRGSPTDVKNIAMLNGQVLRSIISAKVSADMLERTLRYSRLKPSELSDKG